MKRLKNAFVLLLLLHLGCERHQEQHEQKGEVASDTTVHYSAPTDFYSINDGNQRKPMFAPSYNKAWFDSLEKVYSWEYFDKYNNRFYAYMTKLFDALPALSKGLKSSKRDFFNALTRGQKVFYCTLVFCGDVDNDGIYEYFCRRPEFCFAVLETFRELHLDSLAQDYQMCLKEFLGSEERYKERKAIINGDTAAWNKRWELFEKGEAEMEHADKIESYFSSVEYKKAFFKTVVEYIDKHREQFVMQ